MTAEPPMITLKKALPFLLLDLESALAHNG
jgi:hypothetical protein